MRLYLLKLSSFRVQCRQYSNSYSKQCLYSTQSTSRCKTSKDFTRLPTGGLYFGLRSFLRVLCQISSVHYVIKI
ncbi:hypothetical protein KUTeg_003794 [Tegillarca granosa]|uniref:Uncharacterized protein n=1 Tax=Tegillarca granosa TaxID=220873 RepID=A0ABQ9FSN4_TEGGR|nr:hypothetical protein KUTeg_003794 [Tegillarca granosa]